MARFFPIQTPILALSTPTPTEEGGHTDITPSPAGTLPDLLLPVLQGVLSSTRQLRDAIAQTEMRMVGGSILIIYEGHPERLKAALEGGTAFAVKLIDFAHTKLEEGLGPDEGVVLGLDTTISLLEGRIKEVQEALGSA
jgi:inositol-polyphosphate multikinase